MKKTVKLLDKERKELLLIHLDSDVFTEADLDALISTIATIVDEALQPYKDDLAAPAKNTFN